MNRRNRDWFGSWFPQDEESRNAFLLIAGISMVVVIALAVAAYGYFQQAGDDDAVVVVGGEKVGYDYLRKRMSPYMRGDGSLSTQDFSGVVSALLSELEKEKLLLHIAKTKGIEVSEEELDAEMRDELLVPDEASREVFATALRRELLSSGLSLGEFRTMHRADVIESKLREQLRQAVPASAEQADIRLLQVATQTDALDAKNRLANGEALSTLAATKSRHSSANKAGEVGWVLRGTFDQKLDDAIFAQPVGTISDIVETESGFYIFEVRAKETRAVEDAARSAVVSRSFSKALQEARDEIGSEVVMTNAQINRLTSYYISSLNLGG